MQSDNVDPTHVVFDGKNVIISPNLRNVFTFLMEIDKEIEWLLLFENKLSKIREKFAIIFHDLSEISKILEINKIDFPYSITKEALTIVDDFHPPVVIRSQMICLFAYMETIFCLMTIYNHETTDQKQIIDYTGDDIKSLIKEFILSEENEYYKNNKKRLWKISAKKLKNVRNSLTHFYSVSWLIGVINQGAAKKARELENDLHLQKNIDIVFISPHELYELLKFAVQLLLIKWNNDFLENPETFTRKFWYVRTIVDSSASKFSSMS